jgi:hypothetical protein
VLKKPRRFSTAHENRLRVEKVELAITHFHTNGLKRYNLLIVINKFRVGIDHIGRSGVRVPDSPPEKIGTYPS